MELIFNPCGDFGEAHRAQLAKSTLLTSTLVPLGSFRSFKVCPDAKEREWDEESNGKLPDLFIPSKTATWFLSLRWKTCRWANLQPWCLSLQWMTCPWAEHSNLYIYIYIIEGLSWWVISSAHRPPPSDIINRTVERNVQRSWNEIPIRHSPLWLWEIPKKIIRLRRLNRDLSNTSSACYHGVTSFSLK